MKIITNFETLSKKGCRNCGYNGFKDLGTDVNEGTFTCPSCKSVYLIGSKSIIINIREALDEKSEEPIVAYSGTDEIPIFEFSVSNGQTKTLK
jgi:Na+-translocating ferredoxin:NAD+ oxidoreductase RNF subunit RnfB